MNKLLLSLSIIFNALQSNSQSIIIDTVSLGTGYANQKWYSLQNDEQGTQAKDNWDIAFEISGYSASILANNQKTNFAVYKTPYAITQYSTLDTAGISSWPLLYNSDSTWVIGAFNRGANPNNPNDLGWGVYNSSNHIISGDSCYIIKLSNTSFKKIKFIDLNSGVYSFEYADIDGANSQTQSITKSSYTGKNFAYFDLTNNTAVNREPISANWDLTFVKYISFVPTPYGVTGVLSNKGVSVAQANNIASPATYNNWSAHSYNTAINEIGYDWKEINMATFAWDIKMDTVYFVKAKTGDLWKLRFTKFSGSGTGEFIFSKEKLSTVGVNDLSGKKLGSLTIYPTPTNQQNVTILYNIESEANQATIVVYDVTGREVFTDNLRTSNGLYNYTLNTSDLTNGIYSVNLLIDDGVVTQKLIKQ